jgi:ABC-type amino acid transport substrate-binding protein
VTSRRRFVGWLAAGVVVGGSGLAVVRTRGYDVPRAITDKLAVLAPWQYVVIGAFGARALAPERADVAGFADGYLVDLAAADRRDLLAFVAYLEHGAPLSLGKLERFSRLSPDDQDRVLASLEQSSVELLRAGFQGLKALAMMAYYRTDASWKALGYGGPVVRWQG